MKTDRDLLELAAKASGIEDEFVEDGRPFLDRGLWNPRDDDGDCARMEAALGIDIEWWEHYVVATIRHYPSDIFASAAFADCDNDRQAARRRASLLVAAAIQLSKEQA